MKPNESACESEEDHLYHVVLTTSQIQKNPNGEIEKIRVLGTYVSLPKAKIAAHSCLFEAGYEREWFDKYEVDTEVFDRENVHARTGLAIFAIALDGTTFRVRILTTPNFDHFSTDNEDARVAMDLYYVIQGTFDYYSSEDRFLNVEGVFKSSSEARDIAARVLLSEEDGIKKENFAQYNEARETERDCGFSEDVIVHAVGENGENYVVSVIKGQAMESVKLAEAAMRIF